MKTGKDGPRRPQHRAMSFIGKYVEEFGDQQVVALFLPVQLTEPSPMRAECHDWSRNFSTYFWPIFKASWSHALCLKYGNHS